MKGSKWTLIMIICCLLLWTGSSISTAANPIYDKPKIALVIGGTYSQPNDTAGKLIRETLNERFPKNQYLLLEDPKVTQDILIKVEEEKLYDISVLSKEQLIEIGKNYNYDYVILLFYTYGTSDYNTGFWSSSYTVSTVLKAKVIDIQNDEYLYRQDLSVEGQSSDGFGNPSFSRAMAKSMKNTTDKFCKEFQFSSK